MLVITSAPPKALGAKLAFLIALILALFAAAPALDAQESVQGRLVGLIIDREDKTTQEKIFVVNDATGRATELVDSRLAIVAGGGLQRLNNNEVVVAGRRLSVDQIQATSVRATRLAPLFNGPSAYIPTGNAVLGPQPIVTILCRFPDLPALSLNRAHFERVTGNTFPGVDAFMMEASNGQASLAGSQVSEWVTLAKPRTHYFGSGMAVGTGFTSQYTRDLTLADDCAAAAGAGPALSAAKGITLQLNYNPGAAWAYMGPVPFVGSQANGRLRLVIMADWAANAAGVYAHEIGHSFGLLHSGTPAGVYDSKWDVMSAANHALDAASGIRYATHFNTTQKAFLRWMPAERIAGVAAGNVATLSLRSASRTGSGLAMITVADPTDPAKAYFTLEARTRATPFEQVIPHEGVVLHAVKQQAWTEIASSSYAMPVDGGDVNSSTAILVPGRSYEMGGVRITVTARDGEVYTVQVANQPVFKFVSDSAVKLFVGMSFMDSVRVAGAPSGSATLSVAGSLPPGMTFNAQARTISGAPQTTGAFPFVVTATSGTTSISRQSVIEVLPGSVFRLPAHRSIPIGKQIVDTLAEYPKTAGWPTPIRWTWTGQLPPGLQGFEPVMIGGPNGRPDVFRLNGRPTAIGTWRTGVGVYHAGGLDTLWFSITIGAPELTVPADSIRPAGIVSSALSDSLRASSTFGGVTWRVLSGQLPRGVTLAPSGGISGTADSAGSYRVIAEASSGPTGGIATKTQTYLFSVSGPTVTILTDSIRPSGVIGNVYSDTLRATTNVGTITWRLASGQLPRGLALSAAGLITGTLDSAGTYRAVMEASAGPPGSVSTKARTYVFAIAPPSLIVNVDSLRPQGMMGAAYSDSMAATSPFGRVRWRLMEGTLPPGLALDSLGAIRGVAEAAGEFRVTLAATVGPAGSTAETIRKIVIRILKPTLQSAQVMDALLGTTPLSTDLARFMDLIGNRNGRVDVGDAYAWLIDTGVLQRSSSLDEVIPALARDATPKP